MTDVRKHVDCFYPEIEGKMAKWPVALNQTTVTTTLTKLPIQSEITKSICTFTAAAVGKYLAISTSTDIYNFAWDIWKSWTFWHSHISITLRATHETSIAPKRCDASFSVFIQHGSTLERALISNSMFKSMGMWDACIIRQSQAPIHGQLAATTCCWGAWDRSSIQTCREMQMEANIIIL